MYKVGGSTARIGSGAGHFAGFASLKKLAKRGSSKNESLYITFIRKKYQQDQMILRALMYSIKET